MIYPGKKEDINEIFTLYKEVAAQPGFLARLEGEIDLDYIRDNIDSSINSGLCLITRDSMSNQVIAEIHGYTTDIYCFSHVIGGLTIAVSPNHQGQGLGYKIFNQFIEQIKADKPKVTRIELMVRASNSKATKLYEKLGFHIEGQLKNRILNLDGSKEDDLMMAIEI